MRFPWLGLAGVALVIAGCASVAGDEDLASTESELGFKNDRAAFDFFVAKGLKDFQAAGIIGNLDQESGMDPTIKQYGGGPGRGIAQWSVGGRWDRDAKDNAVAFAAETKKNVLTLDLQLDFIWYELKTFPRYGLAQLQAATTIEQSVLVFQNKFEGCGACAQGKRLVYAKNVLKAYGGTVKPPAPAVDAGAPDANKPEKPKAEVDAGPDASSAPDAAVEPDAGEPTKPDESTTTAEEKKPSKPAEDDETSVGDSDSDDDSNENAEEDDAPAAHTTKVAAGCGMVAPTTTSSPWLSAAGLGLVVLSLRRRKK